MADDDLDLDLELDSEPAPKKRGLFGRSKAAAKPEAAKATQAVDDGAPADEAARKVSVVPPQRPGLFGKVRGTVGDSASRVKLPAWSLSRFLAGLVVLLLVELARENWPAVRLNFLGLHADIPKCIVLIVFFALGFGAAWLVFRRRHAETTEPTEEA